jgi:hypothetical protein
MALSFRRLHATRTRFDVGTGPRRPRGWNSAAGTR